MKDQIKKFLNGIISTFGSKLVVELIKKYLTEENIKSAIDAGLDVIEDLVAKTETNIDDVIILPILKKLRETLNIPDND